MEPKYLGKTQLNENQSMINLKKKHVVKNTIRAAMADFWQARPPKWCPHPWCATAAMFYFAKSRQDLGLGGLASRGSPGCKIMLFL